MSSRQLWAILRVSALLICRQRESLSIKTMEKWNLDHHTPSIYWANGRVWEEIHGGLAYKRTNHGPGECRIGRSF